MRDKRKFDWKEWADDIAYTLGVASLATAGFLLHIAAGFAILGIGLIAFALLCGRGQ